QELLIGAETYPQYPARMGRGRLARRDRFQVRVGEVADHLAGRYVPQLHGAIAGAGGELLAVLRERRGEDLVAVTERLFRRLGLRSGCGVGGGLELLHQIAARHVPKLDRLVVTGREDLLTSWCPDHAVDRVGDLLWRGLDVRR